MVPGLDMVLLRALRYALPELGSEGDWAAALTLTIARILVVRGPPAPLCLAGPDPGLDPNGHLGPA